jgi:hypothetical protein
MCRSLFFILLLTAISSCNNAQDPNNIISAGEKPMGDPIIVDGSNVTEEPAEEISDMARPLENSVPVCEVINEIAASENIPLEFQLPCSDPELKNLTFHSDNLPEGAFLDSATGLLKWTPSYSQAGIHTLSLVVSDGELNIEKEISINVSNVYLPSSTFSLSQIIQTKKSIAEEIYNLSYTAGTGILNNDDQTCISSKAVGTYFDGQCKDSTFKYFDPNMDGFINSTDANEFNGILMNNPISLNRGQHFNMYNSRQCFPDGSCQAFENEMFKFVLTISGTSALPLTYSATNLPTGASFDPSTKTFSFKPSSSQIGVHLMTFSVTDGLSVSEETVSLTVARDTHAEIIKERYGK